MNPLLKVAHRALELPVVYRTFGALISPRDRGAFAREHVRVRAGQRVLDVGCGPADIRAYLPPVEYVGFDANPEYIETARRNYGEGATFYCKRVSEEELEAHAGFDVVLASGLLHHLDDEEAGKLFRLAHAALKPGGRLVTLDGCYVDGQGRVARYIISRDRGRYVRDERGYRALASTTFSRVEACIRSDLLRIPYTHLILNCTKTC